MSTLRVASLGFVLASLMLAGCATTPDAMKDIRVAAAPHPKANVSAYKTYAWAAAAAAVRDPEHRWSPSNLAIGPEIMFLVDRELSENGMIKVVDDPDVLLVYTVGVDMANIEVVEASKSDANQTKNVPKGGLLVVMVDPNSGRPIWLGGANGDIQERPTAELTKKRLDYAITKMFKGFPNKN